MPASPTPTPAPDVLGDFKVAAPSRRAYAPSENARRAPVPAVSDVAHVTRGAHVKSGLPVLLVVDGSAQHALPLSAIGAAIAGGVITREEVAALLG